MNIKETISKLQSMATRFLHPLVFVIPLSLWGMYLRIVQRADVELKGDEIYQLKLCVRSFWEFLKELPNHDFCRYLNGDYFLMYPFFKIFGWNKWGLAIPHMIATLLGFYLLYLICKQYFKTPLGYIVTFTLFSLNETLIWHALEIRPYAILTVLSLVVLYFMHQLFAQKFEMSAKKQLAVGTLFILTAWFHPFGILILIFITLYYLGCNLRSNFLKPILKNMLPFFSIVLFIAMPFWIWNVFGFNNNQAWRNINIFEYIPNPMVDSIGFLKGIFCNLVGYKMLYPVIIGFIIAVLLPQKDRYKQMGFFLVLVVIPIATIFLSDVYNTYWFIQRQFIWVMPLFALLMGWAWETCYLFLVEKLTNKKFFTR